MSEFLAVLIGAALINNLIVGQALAADALRGARLSALGPATALLIVLACPLAWAVQHGLLRPLGLEYLQLLVLVALAAPLAWLSLQLLTRLRPHWASDTLWPLLLVNGAGLGSMLLAQALDSFTTVLALSFGAGLGFWLALQLLADLLERIEACDVPVFFKGTPVCLISAGLMGLAFLGFSGLAGA